MRHCRFILGIILFTFCVTLSAVPAVADGVYAPDGVSRSGTSRDLSRLNDAGIQPRALQSQAPTGSIESGFNLPQQYYYPQQQYNSQQQYGCPLQYTPQQYSQQYPQQYPQQYYPNAGFPMSIDHAIASLQTSPDVRALLRIPQVREMINSDPLAQSFLIERFVKSPHAASMGYTPQYLQWLIETLLAHGDLLERDVAFPQFELLRANSAPSWERIYNRSLSSGYFSPCALPGSGHWSQWGWVYGHNPHAAYPWTQIQQGWQTAPNWQQQYGWQTQPGWQQQQQQQQGWQPQPGWQPGNMIMYTPLPSR